MHEKKGMVDQIMVVKQPRTIGEDYRQEPAPIFMHALCKSKSRYENQYLLS